MLPRVDLIRTDEDDWLLLNRPDIITDFIRENGYWKGIDTNIAMLLAIEYSNASVIDAGANIGGFSVPVAKKLANNKGRLFAFEPQRIVFQQLCSNIFLNRLDNVFAYNVALGDTSKLIEIPELDFWQSKNIGAFSVDENIRTNLTSQESVGITNFNKESGHFFEVEQRTLDSFNLEFDINFIKVDIEGYELEFFKGAAGTIKANKYPPIIFELWPYKWYQKKGNQVLNLLTDWGYKLQKLDLTTLFAQHPDHPAHCTLTPKNNDIKISLV